MFTLNEIIKEINWNLCYGLQLYFVENHIKWLIPFWSTKINWVQF